MSLDALKEQNLFVFCNCVKHHWLQDHPDFKWTSDYAAKQFMVEMKELQALAAESHQVHKFKFGALMPNSVSHTSHLDKINSNTLWEDIIKAELDSINKMETFHVLEEGEELQESYTQVPHHTIFNKKFEGKHKSR